MNVSYSQPLSLGWNRMKKALFQPFDISKWIKVGFTAWLASFTDCNGGSGGNSSNIGNKNDWGDFFNFPQTAWQWLMDNPLWFNLILVGLVFLIVFISVIIWLSSQGKFMFLHNVVHDKAEIGEPWKEFRKEGNSLFLWEFCLGWFAFIVIIAFFAYCFGTAKTLYYGDFTGVEIFMSAAKLVLLFIVYLIVFGYISLLLKDFVVPLMYKYRIGVLQAWGKFLTLLGTHIFAFVGYGLFIFILGLAVAVGIILIALLTCCIGLLLIAIPFVGAVILLPVSYTFRALSLEFLKQFGEEYNVFPVVQNDLETNH